jgi:hypothetical protein
MSWAAPASARNSRWRENQATMMAGETKHDVQHDGGDQHADARAELFSSFLRRKLSTA